MKNQTTYKDAGVDIDTADSTKKSMEESLQTSDQRVLHRHGSFAALFEASFPGILNPVLVLKAEEPGSKQLLAFEHGFVREICFDLINHLINDIIVMGARPLAVLDTIVCGELKKDVILQLVKGISEACKLHDCSLVGGETSEQPRVLDKGRHVLCATVMGVVEKSKIVDGSKIQEGDLVLALPSSGPHTNGYTLIRTLIERRPEILKERIGERTFLQAIMEPHRSYYKPLTGIFEIPGLTGLAHITGGGIQGNLNRILPQNLSAEIDLSCIRVPEIFRFIQKAAGAPSDDMLRTFNMGVGMCVVCRSEAQGSITAALREHGCDAYAIGRVMSGTGDVRCFGALG